MSANTFGITFQGSLTEITNNAFGTQFYSACNTFGIRPFETPAGPIVPVPFAEYDFNNYIATSPTLVDTLGGSDATILEEMSNTFNTSTAGNYYLEIYAPNVFPSPTGGVVLPSFSNIKAIEMWVNYPSYDGYAQYVLDARVGATNGFWITTGDTIGSDWDNGKFYNNTVGTVISSSAGTPIVSNELAGLGWRQVFFIPVLPIADDVALFCRYTGVQSMAINVASISLYDTIPTDADVKSIFNSQCTRYGLSPIP